VSCGQLPSLLSVLVVKGGRLAALDGDDCEGAQVSLIGGFHWRAKRSSSPPKLCFHPLHQGSSSCSGLEYPGRQPPCLPRFSIIARFQDMLTAVDNAPLTRRQRLHLNSAGVCPRLSWPLLTQEFPITWVERELDSLATRHIKHWGGLSSQRAQPFSTALTQWVANLPFLSTVYKKLRVSRQTQLLTSRDGCVRFQADRNLRREQSLSRKTFQPATLAREVLEVRPDGERRALIKAAKTLVAEDINTGWVWSGRST
jgi:hypothetical protein